MFEEPWVHCRNCSNDFRCILSENYTLTVHGNVNAYKFLQAVEQQFADTDYDLTVRRKVQFQSTARDMTHAIEMKFERNLPNGWSITRESDDKVVY